MYSNKYVFTCHPVYVAVKLKTKFAPINLSITKMIIGLYTYDLIRINTFSFIHT